MTDSLPLKRGDEIAPGNIFFLGWTDLDRDADAVECLKCGGFAPEADCTAEEIESTLNCGRPWACCVAAFVCKKCGARMVGHRNAPEME
jgi:hypothetical protein